MTEQELEAGIAADSDDTRQEPDWKKEIKGLSPSQGSSESSFNPATEGFSYRTTHLTEVFD